MNTPLPDKRSAPEDDREEIQPGDYRYYRTPSAKTGSTPRTDAMDAKHVAELDAMVAKIESGAAVPVADILKQAQQMMIAYGRLCAEIEAERSTPSSETKRGNTPIETLKASYEAEGCDHSNIEWVKFAARRYVQTMEDSQVRVLLHVLSSTPPTKTGSTPAAPEGFSCFMDGCWLAKHGRGEECKYECQLHAAPSTLALHEWLRDNAPDCGDNSCLFGGRGKGGMRTNGGCRCFKDVQPATKRIFIERLYSAFVSAIRGSTD